MAGIRLAFGRLTSTSPFRLYSRHNTLQRHIRSSCEYPKISGNTEQDGLINRSITGRRFQPRSTVSTSPKLEFDNTIVAYRGKATLEIIRALFVLNMCKIKVLVTYNMPIMKSFQKMLGRRVFESIMKRTFYGQFVAGEDAVSIQPKIDQLAKFGIKPILDYCVECDIPQVSSDLTTGDLMLEDKDDKGRMKLSRKTCHPNEAEHDHNLETLKQCVDAAGETSTDAFAAVKITALARPQLLLNISESITQTRELFRNLAGTDANLAKGKLQKDHFQSEIAKLDGFSKKNAGEWFSWLDKDRDGWIDILDWEKEMRPDKISKLPLHISASKEDQLELAKVLERTCVIVENCRFARVSPIGCKTWVAYQAKRAREKGVHLTIDAEQTYFQPAINWITIEMMKKFNTESPVVFNTYQCYLKDIFNNLSIDMEHANKDKFHFAAKLVRGAYMEQERARATELGIVDPINESYKATDETYKRCLNLMLQAVKHGRVSVMVASHNEDTVRFTVQRMQELQIGTKEHVVCFGQLLGMCDYISFPLGYAGYSVFKYIPYGPVSDVLPYLTRRAQENRGIQKSNKKELEMLWKELKRRVIPFKRRHSP